MKAGSNQVRIIAGQWRGRKLSFSDGSGLRPTSDRIRETLFNWLAPVLPGAACLDLFAGSGALGFEAASRGARRVVLVERDPVAARRLEENRQRLGADGVEIHCQDALAYLERVVGSFDAVFLDPPFADPALLNRALSALAAAGCLNADARVYVEQPRNAPPPAVPPPWELLREKVAGQVAYRLYRASPPPE